MKQARLASSLGYCLWPIYFTTSAGRWGERRRRRKQQQQQQQHILQKILLCSHHHHHHQSLFSAGIRGSGWQWLHFPPWLVAVPGWLAARMRGALLCLLSSPLHVWASSFLQSSFTSSQARLQQQLADLLGWWGRTGLQTPWVLGGNGVLIPVGWCRSPKATQAQEEETTQSNHSWCIKEEHLPPPFQGWGREGMIHPLTPSSKGESFLRPLMPK